MILESGIPEHLARQKLRILRESGCQAEIFQDGVRFGLRLRPGALTAHIEAEMATLRRLHERILESARRQGIELLPYKAFDAAETAAALASATQENPQTAEGAARLWHELVWAQGFPNGNHRTATAYLERVLNPAGATVRDLAARLEWLDELFVASKRLVAEKEFSPAPNNAKAQHLALCRAAFGAWFNQAAGQ